MLQNAATKAARKVKYQKKANSCRGFSRFVSRSQQPASGQAAITQPVIRPRGLAQSQQAASGGGDLTVREGEISQHEAGAPSQAAPAAVADTSCRPGDSTDFGCAHDPTCLAPPADPFWLKHTSQTVSSGDLCSSQSRYTAGQRHQQRLLSALPAKVLPAKLLAVFSSIQHKRLQHGT